MVAAEIRERASNPLVGIGRAEAEAGRPTSKGSPEPWPRPVDDVESDWTAFNAADAAPSANIMAKLQAMPQQARLAQPSTANSMPRRKTCGAKAFPVPPDIAAGN
jgi:hypothetical protein